MSGTVRTPTYLITTSLADNTTGQIGANDDWDVVETLAALPPSPNGTQTGSPYVAQLTDRGTVVEMNNASPNIFQVPTNASVAFQIGTVIAVYQMGTGQTSVAAVTPATTTIRNSSSATVRAQYAQVYLRKRATDEWVLSGDVS